MIGLPELIGGVLIVALNAYALLGGADFGGGVWDLLARGRKRAAQRSLIAEAIGPVWEANHVWLILAVVILFTAFPPVYASLSTVLHIPISLMLLGIVMRGSAFVFRHYGPSGDGIPWGRIFAIASVATPVFLGILIGTVASGRAGEAIARLHAADLQPASFAEIYVRPWLAPFPIAVGVMTLALFSLLAAVYLTVAASEDVRREEFRRRALGAAAAVFVTAFGTLTMARLSSLHLGRWLTESPGAIVVHAVTGLAAVITWWALWVRRWRVARVAVAVQTSGVLWGWAAAQFPYLVPPALTIRDAAAPAVTLRLVVGTLLGGAVILLPALAYLFKLLGRVTRAGGTPH